MAQISSYPSLTPQLGDKLLGSNSVDASGSPVTGNPTAQYTLTSVKTLVDQQLVQQLSTFKTGNYAPPRDNVGEVMIFGAVDVGTTANNVQYTALTGTITFNTIGTYLIRQYYLGASGAATNNTMLLFKTMKNGATQVDPTTTASWYAGANANRFPICIETSVNVTQAGDYYNFWSCSPTAGAVTTLEAQSATSGVVVFGTDVPCAELIILKLV